MFSSFANILQKMEQHKPGVIAMAKDAINKLIDKIARRKAEPQQDATIKGPTPSTEAPITAPTPPRDNRPTGPGSAPGA